MIGSIGLPEILFILVLALLVFGPKRLPNVGRTLGRALGEFRRATSDLKRTIDREITAADLTDDEGPRRPKLAAVESPDPDEPADGLVEPESPESPTSPTSPTSEDAPESPVARTELAVED